jgi:hypothetical protein
VTSRFSSDHNPGIDLIHFFRFWKSCTFWWGI